MKEGLIPFIEKHHILSEPTLVLEDNTTIHIYPVAKRLKNDNGIEVIDWPGWSPDLNPIENIWSIVKRRVDTHNLQSINDLKKYMVYGPS